MGYQIALDYESGNLEGIESRLKELGLPYVRETKGDVLARAISGSHSIAAELAGKTLVMPEKDADKLRDLLRQHGGMVGLSEALWRDLYKCPPGAEGQLHKITGVKIDSQAGLDTKVLRELAEQSCRIDFTFQPDLPKLFSFLSNYAKDYETSHGITVEFVPRNDGATLDYTFDRHDTAFVSMRFEGDGLKVNYAESPAPVWMQNAGIQTMSEPTGWEGTARQANLYFVMANNHSDVLLNFVLDLIKKL